ncbi:MAG: ABC-2 type transport system permease protein [Glaciecola sp.]|jgi:ABC-2 type transport system permease protein|uniref:Gldg family protein n=1 Tax=Congregibacter sp. TaxID=2744308 RepID=UPI0039E59092
MQPDRVLSRVARKELQLFFASPVAWLFLASFMAICLFVFFWVEAFFARNIADVRPLFEWMPLLLIFLSAALTMRSWSEERRSGTLEHVLTLPVPLWQFVMGKFIACAIVLILALAATLLLPITVSSIAALDWGPVFAGYLAAFLLGCSYLAVGLFISSRTDNAIVSLIGSVAVCGLLYLIGSDLLLGFFGGNTAEVLRLLGSGSRFESITRGVIDLRDLYYYLAVTAAFLALNIYALERGRWSQQASAKHRRWRLGISLLVLNLILGGLWLQKFPDLRKDVTEGKLYSLSEPSETLLSQLEEPLLIRGYFSERSHPLLAPLVPQLRDLLREYAVVGKGDLRVEFVDPALDGAAEKEANEEYNIQATPFQVADRYQSALVNAYFNVLVQYGDENEVLGFSDFIEVKTAIEGQPEVLLRNPEFDITRAIRDVLYRYRSGGELFDQITQPVTLRAYVSDDSRLPELLVEYRDDIRTEAEALIPQSQNKFAIDFIEPEANGGAQADRILDEWGFQPMVTALGDENQFYFYLTLEDDHQVIQLPTGGFDPSDFEDALEAGLRRFASGFTRTVALALPASSQGQYGRAPQGHSFGTLQRVVSQDHSIVMENLADGGVDASADLLIVMAPEAIDSQSLFAMDQYLMRGGTVIIASSPRSIETMGTELRLRKVDSGLTGWLSHHGVSIQETVILDERQAAFPLPVVRKVGAYEFRDMQFVDYPYLLDVRDDGLNPEHPITQGLPNLTVGWASPMSVDVRPGITSKTLLTSSGNAWLSDESDVMPSVDDSGQSSFSGVGKSRLRASIGVTLQGEFTSYFDAVPEAPVASDQVEDAAVEAPSSSLISKSPSSTRLIVVSSNDFASDQVLSGIIAASGTQYFGPLEFLMNAVDWSLEDSSLMNIRSRAHFNRTLPALPQDTQASIEYGNYAAALLFLLVIYGLWRLLRRGREAQLREVLA